MGEVELGLIFVGTLDDGIDDVGLAAGGDLFAKEGPDIVHALVRRAAGSDGCAAGWEFVDDRGIKIAVEGKGKGARDGGCGHNEGVGLTGGRGIFTDRGAIGFAHKAEALLDAEAVLFVDDDEAEVVEVHFVFDEGVGADGKLGCAARDAAAGLALGGGVERAGEEGDAVGLSGAGADGFGEELASGEIVLGGEDLGGRHERDLEAVFDGDERGLDGYDGLARADVALEKAAHGLRLAHVGGDLSEDSLLRGGGVEGKDLFEGAADGIICNKGSALSIAQAAALEF